MEEKETEAMGEITEEDKIQGTDLRLAEEDVRPVEVLLGSYWQESPELPSRSHGPQSLNCEWTGGLKRSSSLRKGQWICS